MSRYCLAPLLLLFFAAVQAVSADLPAGAILLDDDLVFEQQLPLNAVVSSDENSIAYVSKGALWCCKTTGGPPTKLADLPNTITELLANSELHDFRGDPAKVARSMGERWRLATINRTKIQGPQWAVGSDRVYWMGAGLSQTKDLVTNTCVMCASIDGVVKTIATLESPPRNPVWYDGFHVTSDEKFVVLSNNRPLIWNAVTNKPQATPYDYLLPSSTSYRYLGVEIDTRQLVLVDENFKVAKRFDVKFDEQQQFDLIWSPDERFALDRIIYSGPMQIDQWIGYRMNLDTGEKQPLGGRKIDHYEFKTTRGELISSGLGKDEIGEITEWHGAYIARGISADVVRFYKPGKLDDWKYHKRYPPIVFSNDGALAAMALPHNDNEHEFRYYLIDTFQNGWRYLTPLGVPQYKVVAIVNDNQTIIACDESRLFSLPVAPIKEKGPER
jgi:hypothetical protein